MHWAYEYANEIKKTINERKDEKKKEAIIAAGTSPSGTVHIGNFRDIVTAYFICKALKEQEIDAKLLFSWDDYDRLRKVPANIKEKRDFFETQIGKPYTEIPSPFNDGISYGRHFEKEYEESLKKIGIIPDIIRYQTEEYKSGRYTEGVQVALKDRKKIYDILAKHRTQKPTEEERESYYPLSVYCSCCGKDNTSIINFDGECIVTYHCNDCGIDESFNIFEKTNYKLPWKVDWPMRWKEEGICLEPGGTDHAAEHGSYVVSKEIAKSVYGYEAPKFVPYSFIGIKGLGVKMSSSSGINISLESLLQVYSPEMIFWLFAKRQLSDEFKIDLGKEVPRVYREFDRFKKEYYENPENADEQTKQIISLISEEKKYEDLIPFDKLATLYGASNKNLTIMSEMIKKLGLKTSNSKAFKDRLSRVFYWAEIYSPESIISINREPATEYFDQMADDQKKYLNKFYITLGDADSLSEEEIRQKLYGLPKSRTDEEVTPELKKTQRQIFKDLYNLMISSDNGPALSTLIKAIGTEKVKHLIEPLIKKYNIEQKINNREER